jgi:hypothetical protein
VNQFQPLIDQLYREEILQARRMTPEERLRGTFEMTETALALMRAGVRSQFPGATEEEVLAHSRERLRRMRRTQDWGLFENPGQ